MSSSCVHSVEFSPGIGAMGIVYIGLLYTYIMVIKLDSEYMSGYVLQ